MKTERVGHTEFVCLKAFFPHFLPDLVVSADRLTHSPVTVRPIKSEQVFIDPCRIKMRNVNSLQQLHPNCDVIVFYGCNEAMPGI